MKTLLIALASAALLAGCAGGLSLGVSGQARKVGSKCYIKQTGDTYLEGRWRQVGRSIECVEEKDKP